MPLTLYKRKGSAFWWLRGTVREQSIRESTGTADRALAEEYRASREAEIYRQALHGEHKQPVTWAAAVVSYLEVKKPKEGTRLRLKRLLPEVAKPCDKIDQAEIDRLAKKLLRPDSSSSTVLREITTPIRAVLNHAARRGWCRPPVFEQAEAGRARTVWLEPAEVDRLSAAASPHLRPLIGFLVCTGARLAEALDLEWSGVMLAHRRIVLRDTKNGRDRIVDLCPRAVGILEGQPHRDGAVFRTHRGEPYADRERLAGGQIKRAWATAVRRAEITKPITPHGLRHTWASWHYAVHRDPLRLCADGDWSSLDLVKRYAHLVPTGLVPAIKAFWEHDTADAGSASASRKGNER